MKRGLAVALLFVLAAPVAEARRRAVAPSRSTEVPQDPAGWLRARASGLGSVEYPAPSSDLQALRVIANGASVVGLGDGTHGTHEFYTVKLRMIDFLVREMDFDVIAFEAPLPIFDRLDAYVRGEPGDPRAILAESNDRLGYLFWDVEEMLAVVEWIRDYNAHRGDRGMARIAGADIFDTTAAASAVVTYLMSVDGAAAAEAQREYACAPAPNPACATRATAIRDKLAARRNELAPRTSCGSASTEAARAASSCGRTTSTSARP